MDPAGGDARSVWTTVRGVVGAKRSQQVTLVVVAIVCFVMPVSVFRTHHFHYSDFLAYYIACRDALGLDGGIDGLMPPFTMQREVFFILRADGRFIAYRYSPFFLFLFTPLARLPYPLACLIFAGINALAVTCLLALCASCTDRHGTPTPWWVMPAVLVLVALHVRRETLLGNVNIILLVVCLLAWRWRTHAVVAGVALAVVVTTKPYFLLATIPFWRIRSCVRWFIVGTLLVLILPLTLYGGEFGWNLTTRWLHKTVRFSGHPYVLAHRDSIVSVWGQCQGQPLNWLSWIFLVLYVSFVATVIARAARRWWGHEAHATAVFFLVLAVMPLIVSNDSQIYVSVAPLVFCTLASADPPAWPRHAGLLLVIGLVGHWFDLGDVYGKAGVHFLRTHGALGIAQMALITWCMLATDKAAPVGQAQHTESAPAI